MLLNTGILSAIVLLLFARDINGQTHSIIHPKLFRIDTDETVVVNLYEYGRENVVIHASLTDYPSQNSIFSSIIQNGNSGDPISFTMKASSEDFEGVETIINKKVEMSVRIQFTSGGYSAINRKILIYLTGESDYLFVQTDRPIYRPGETVLIRAAPMNSKMLPIRTGTFEVSVKTQEGVGIWKRIATFPDDDFISDEYEIPEGSPLGVYSVQVKSTKKTHSSVGATEFKVDKYVLPTYNVDIKTEQSTVAPGGHIDGEITAKYSYGEPVVGAYTLKATLIIPGGEEIDFYKKPQSAGKRPGLLRENSNGEVTFHISTNLVMRYTNRTWQEIMEAKATVSVLVSVMGKAEGIMESAVIDGILVTNTPYQIDMSLSSKYFVPSLEHDLMVVVKDVVTNKPVQGVPIVFSVDGNPNEEGGVTDDNGLVSIPVETSQNSVSILVTVKTDDPQLNRNDQAQADLTLEKRVSDHGYLKMSVDSYNVAIDTNVYVRFETSDRHPQPREIHYMILSRGMILLSSKKSVNSRRSSERIGITRKMSPSVRVVGYFMNGRNIVSDSIALNVDDVCISRELSVTIDPEVIRPGERVEVSYQGERKSMIGTSAVDRSAYFLYDEGRINRNKMFEKMKKFDMGCSASGGRTPFNVFEEAGLACTTATSATSSKFDLECSREEGEAKRRKRSLLDLVAGRSPEEEKLIKRCYRDGRLENLAGVYCQLRTQRIERFDFPNKNLCIRAFLQGCLLGESIREQSLFRMSTQRSGTDLSDADSQTSNVKRVLFNEGWLWMTYRLGVNGALSHSPAPPHSITTYDIDAISIHDTEGFCIARPAELKVFKDFFIQLYLPYSVKIMEQVQIRAAVFNYHETRDREMNISIRVNDNLCTQGVPGRETNLGTLLVPAQSSESFIFSIIPLPQSLEDSQAYIELKAEPISREDAGARDIIRRSLKVEPSGSELEISHSFPLNPSNPGQNPRIELEFPDNVVPDSKKCWIYGFMNYLGPIVEFDPISETPKNLKDSINAPYGCGEQNMMVMGPNVFAFKYLKHVGDPLPRDQEAVQSHIIQGYTRQQTHRNKGKWSLYSSSNPTIWINAYVDKVFLHAKDIWQDMDMGPICDSLEWLASQQRGDGSFSEGSHATYYSINVAEGGEVALTAYVLIAMAETDINCPSVSTNSRTLMVIDQATTYLRRTVNNNVNPYTAAIVTYALALADSNHYTTKRANRRLMRSRRQEGYESYWQSRPDPGHSIDIETTAYALLAQITIAQTQGHTVPYRTKEMINQIANWMVKQQNDRGGFASSQDTVIAIQSMTEYGKWKHDITTPVRNPHLEIGLTAPGVEWEEGQNFNLDSNHEFYRKELQIPPEVISATRVINVAVRGEGQGRLSYRCVYRTTRNSDDCDFDISADTTRVGHFADDAESEAAPGEGKQVIKLVIGVSKAKEGNTGMAIIDISLLSGFKPVESSLRQLKESVDRYIDDYEIFNQKVILYVDTIGHDEPLTIGFKLIQDVTILGVSPAKIAVYDYYDPSVSCSKFYTLPGGSPLLRTSCAPASIDESARQMCKCSEGGCPICRTREDQLLKTCASQRACSYCRDCNLNLHNSVCERNYGVIMTILSINSEDMPQFIKMTARVDQVIHFKTQDNELTKDQTRTFIIRRDCFDKCRDDEVARTLAKTDYLAVNRTYLVRGREPDMSISADGQTEFAYYLDREAMLERTLSSEKCARFRKREKNCEGNTGVKCRNIRGKIQDKLRICDDQDRMIEAVWNGCD